MFPAFTFNWGNIQCNIQCFYTNVSPSAGAWKLSALCSTYSHTNFRGPISQKKGVALWKCSTSKTGAVLQHSSTKSCWNQCFIHVWISACLERFYAHKMCYLYKICTCKCDYRLISYLCRLHCSSCKHRLQVSCVLYWLYHYSVLLEYDWDVILCHQKLLLINRKPKQNN